MLAWPVLKPWSGPRRSEPLMAARADHDRENCTAGCFDAPGSPDRLASAPGDLTHAGQRPPEEGTRGLLHPA
jgi:hypothetical protein